MLIENVQDVDLMSVSTDYPVLATGNYLLEIVKATVEESKNKPGVKMIVLNHVTLTPAKDNKGNDIAAGFKMKNRIVITPTGDLTAENVARSIASLQEAAFGKRIPLSEFDTDMLQGVQVTASVKVQPAKDQYPESSVIARYIKKEVAN
jgi:hypothetical protein